MSTANEPPLVLDRAGLDLDGCLKSVADLLEAVQTAAHDYYNSTPVLTLHDALVGDVDTDVSWSVPIDLKTLAVVAALVQTPLAFRGDTDRGKTALAERVLTGLFGSQGDGWRRMEINRGITIDDLIDIDVEKLSRLTVTEAMSAAKWLGKPARLLDEINRAHPKLLNLVLHLVDGSGFNIRGDVCVPVGLPYRVGDQEKRYSFSIVTANPPDGGYGGVFEEDAALSRRLVISVDLDLLPPSSQDVKLMMLNRRARSVLPPAEPHTAQLIAVYEALPAVLPFSGLAQLFLYYLAAMSTCVRTRSGRFQPHLRSSICNGCHLSKANRLCGHIGALGEGLVLWVKELAVAIAAMRACGILGQARRHCLGSSTRTLAIAELQAVLRTNVTGQDLLDRFRDAYLKRLQVTGEDVKAAYVLVAPGHVWIDRDWMKGQSECEGNPLYLLHRVAGEAWESMTDFLREHHGLAGRLAEDAPLASADQAEIEEFVTTRDAAMLGVINALRDSGVILPHHGQLRSSRATEASKTGGLPNAT